MTEPLPRGGAKFRTVGRRGFYESFFAKAGDEQGERAVWIRYTIHRRRGEAPIGSLWVTLFDANAGAPLATKETFPADLLSDDPYIRIGKATLTPGELHGDVAAGPTASWQLSFEFGEPLLRHLAPRMYGAAVPRTKLESLHPSSRFIGTVAMGDRRVSVDGWPGTIGHNWGTQHARRWIWIHAAAFDEHGADTWIDVAIARVLLGPFTSPWIANGAITIDGVRHRVGGLLRVHQTKVAETYIGCDLALGGRNVSVEVRVTADPSQVVGWLYADPDGATHHVLHTSLAEMTVRVTRRADHATPAQLHTRSATYELGMQPTPDHGVQIQPFDDG